MTLRISNMELSKVFRHSAETYPEECCGFLIGVDGPTGTVFEARRATNVHPEHRGVRYTVDPREQLRLELELRGTRREIIGFYHSHPDHPGVPSAFDVERSWPAYAYIIVEVRDGRPVTARGFRMDPDTKTVREESVFVTPPRRPREPPAEKAHHPQRGRRRGHNRRGAK